MKKTKEIITPLEKKISENNLNDFKTKTTNVNILLNRVKIEKKNYLKKKNHFHINHYSTFWISYNYCNSLI